MKKNVNVFIGVVLCAVLCGVFVWLSTASEEDTWKPNEIYNEVHAAGSYSSSYTTANFSAPSTNGGVALTLSSSPMMRHSGASFYAGASYAPTASSPFVSSPMGGASGAGLYTTSSAELKSFGGGGNGGAAMGGASSAASRSVSTGQSFGGLAVASSPISYSTGRRGGMNTSDANTAMMAEDPALAVASASSFGYDAAASYFNFGTADQYNAMYGGGNGRSNVRGRQNGAPTMGGDNWWFWLESWLLNPGHNGSSYYGEDGYYFDDNTLHGVYNDFLANYWNSGMGEAPSYEQWKAWYLEAMNNENGYYTYNGNNYYWGTLAPVGDIVPLLLMALLYIAFIAFKSIRLRIVKE